MLPVQWLHKKVSFLIVDAVRDDIEVLCAQHAVQDYTS